MLLKPPVLEDGRDKEEAENAFWISGSLVDISSVQLKYNTFALIIQGHLLLANGYTGKGNFTVGPYLNLGSNLKHRICPLKSESLLANNLPVYFAIWAVGVSISSLAIVFKLENCQTK